MPAYAAFLVLLSTAVFFGLGAGGGEDAVPYTWPDLTATMVLWLAGLVAMLLIISETASPYYQRRAATREATPANGTGR